MKTKQFGSNWMVNNILGLIWFSECMQYVDISICHAFIWWIVCVWLDIHAAKSMATQFQIIRNGRKVRNKWMTKIQYSITEFPASFSLLFNGRLCSCVSPERRSILNVFLESEAFKTQQMSVTFPFDEEFEFDHNNVSLSLLSHQFPWRICINSVLIFLVAMIFNFQVPSLE